MEALTQVTVTFTLILALALLIERCLKVFETFLYLLDSRYDLHRLWTRWAQVLAGRLERRLQVLEYADGKLRITAIMLFREALAGSSDGSSGDTVPIIAGDQVRAMAWRTLSKILAVSVGIALAFALDLDLVSMWRQAGGNGTIVPDTMLVIALQKIATGTVLGLGAAPVEKIISAIESRQKRRNKE